jgi:hypothetical protein
MVGINIEKSKITKQSLHELIKYMIKILDLDKIVLYIVKTKNNNGPGGNITSKIDVGNDNYKLENTEKYVVTNQIVDSFLNMLTVLIIHQDEIKNIAIMGKKEGDDIHLRAEFDIDFDIGNEVIDVFPEYNN